MSSVHLPRALAAAYRATRYTAGDDGVWVRVDETSPALDALLDAHGADGGVFVTAWNPGSRWAEPAANAAAHRRLVAALAGRRTLPHRGVGDDPGWPPEEGLFVLDAPEDEMVALARAFGQVAIVAVRRGEPARLLLTGVPPMS